MVDINIKVQIPALEQLLKMFASGVGAVAGTVFPRIKANTRADLKRIEAQSDADVRRIRAAGEASAIQQIATATTEARTRALGSGASLFGTVNLAEEIESRINFQEYKRQSNIYDVVSMAAKRLGDGQVDENEVDHDWTARFFSDVQDVTSEQMQCIWARILSGEVETPGRTSLHALSILRNMSQHDAKEFANVARFVIDHFVLSDDQYTSNIHGFPSYKRVLHLESYGLMATGTFLQNKYQCRQHFGHKYGAIIAHNEIVFMIFTDTHKDIDLPVYVLTPTGRQIYDNLDAGIDESYLQAFAKYLKEKADAELAMAPIIERSSGHFRYGQLIDVLSGQPIRDS